MRHETFHEWFRLHVNDLLMRSEQVTDEVQALAKGPLLVAKKYNSYTISTQSPMMRVVLFKVAE